MRRAVSLMLMAALATASVFAQGTKESGARKASGDLILYTTVADAQYDMTIAAFNKQYPDIKVYYTYGGAGDCKARIQAEAANPQADAMYGGLQYADIATYGDYLESYVSVNDKDMQEGFHNTTGKVTFHDSQIPCLVVNDKLEADLGVKVTGWKSLLDPKLKGKIIIAAPDASSSGYRQLQTVLAVMGDTFDDQKGWDYIARLIPLCYSTNSSKDVFNLVNEGEYAVGLSYESTPAGIIAQGGATMRLVYMKEGNTAMPGGAAIVKNAPNLVAAQAMMDLLASKEFQDRRADLAGRGTNRNCKASDLPANNTLGLKDLDYGYLAANKSKLMDHFNDLWSSLHK